MNLSRPPRSAGLHLRRRRLRRRLLLAEFFALLLLLSFTPLGFLPLGPVRLTLLHLPVIFASLFYGPRFGLAVGGLFGVCSLLTNSLTPGLTSFAFSPLIPVYGSGRGSLWALLVCFPPRLILGYLPGKLTLLCEARARRRRIERRATKETAVSAAEGQVSPEASSDGRAERNEGFAAEQTGSAALPEAELRARLWARDAAFSLSASLLHSVLVLGLMLLFFARPLASLRGTDLSAVCVLLAGVGLSNGIPEAALAFFLVPALLRSLHRWRKLS